MSAPRYDIINRLAAYPPDSDTLAHNETVFRLQQEWCAKQNAGGHRKLRGTSTCLDCGQDLDR